MKRNLYKVLFVSLLAVILAGCNLPFGPTAVVPTVEGTPNLTLTALFSPGGGIPPTVTPPALVTATQAPPSETPTEVPPTATEIQPTATDTEVPPTHTAVVMQRSGTLYKAKYLKDEPVLDGAWADWREKTYYYTSKAVVWGAKNWSGSGDLQLGFIVGWDETYLYIGVEGIDDIYVQKATGEDIYKGDSVELLLDVDLYNDYYSQALTSDDYQLGISPGNPDSDGKTEAYLWFPAKVAGPRTKISIGSKNYEDSYKVEARIPWSTFGIKPYSGMHLGFAISLSDNDNKTANVQQTMVSSAAGRILTDPTTWGEIVLTK